MTLRIRITLLVAIAVAIAVTAVAGASYVSASRELQDEVDQFLVQRSQLVPGREFRSGRRGFGAGGLDGGFVVVGADSVVQIVTPDGEKVPFDEDTVLPFDEQDHSSARRGRPVLRDIRVDDERYRMITVDGPAGSTVQIARSLTETDQVLQGLRVRLLLLGGGGVALAALAGWFVANRALIPVDRLTAAAEHVASTQDLSAAITIDRADEVGRLATSFNTMLEALEASRQQQHRLVMDASHELRTPLTSLRTNIEVLARREDIEPEDRSRLMQDVTHELEELTTLVTELVELATDAHAGDEPLQDVMLDDLVTRVVERARRRSGRDILLTAAPVPIEGRPATLERAVTNLVDNALKWGPDGTPVEVHVADGTVEVRDHGPGIAADDIPHVFDRFYRSSAARSMPGSGLGLAIVSQIVLAHAGKVWAASAPDGGACVGFSIPTTPVAAV